MDNNTKKTLVNATYDLLKDMRVSELSVHAVSEASGCPAEVIFDNFDSLDHLIRITSIRILDAYSQESKNVVDGEGDPLEVDAKLWAKFLPYTFKFLDVFELLFWTWSKNTVRTAYEEYYTLFPENKDSLASDYTDVFLGTDLRERNTVMLTRAVEQGIINKHDVPVLANLSIGLLHAMMVTYKGIYRDTELPLKATTEYLTALKSLHDHYRLK